MPYLFLLLLLLVQLAFADPENFEEPQPKRGNNGTIYSIFVISSFFQPCSQDTEEHFCRDTVNAQLIRRLLSPRIISQATSMMVSFCCLNSQGQKINCPYRELIKRV
jgi:hypothetical protein